MNTSKLLVLCTLFSIPIFAMEMKDPNRGTKQKIGIKKQVRPIKKSKKIQTTLHCSLCKSTFNYKTSWAHRRSVIHTNNLAKTAQQDTKNCIRVIKSPYPCEDCKQYFITQKEQSDHRFNFHALQTAPTQDTQLWLDLNTGEEFNVPVSFVQWAKNVPMQVLDLNQPAESKQIEKPKFLCKDCDGNYFPVAERTAHENSPKHVKKQKEHKNWLKKHIQEITEKARLLSEQIAQLNQNTSISSDQESNSDSTTSISDSQDPESESFEIEEVLAQGVVPKSDASENENTFYMINNTIPLPPIDEQQDAKVFAEQTNKNTIWL